jgi:hypothetical protein
MRKIMVSRFLFRVRESTESKPKCTSSEICREQYGATFEGRAWKYERERHLGLSCETSDNSFEPCLVAS